MCSWLRPASSYLKRLTTKGGGWDAEVSPAMVDVAVQLISRLRDEDPVRGECHLPAQADDVVWAVYTDASDVALGVVLTAGGKCVEDCCWLRNEDDKRYIYVV